MAVANPTKDPSEQMQFHQPRAALYLRISTKNHGQTTDTQAVALREYAERRGFDVIEYHDEGISGSKNSRPALDRLAASTTSVTVQHDNVHPSHQ